LFSKLNNDEYSNLSQQKCTFTNIPSESFEEIKLATKQLYNNFIYSGENKSHHLIFTKCLIEKFENYFFEQTQNDECLKTLENLIEGVYQEVFFVFWVKFFCGPHFLFFLILPVFVFSLFFCLKV